MLKKLAHGILHELTAAFSPGEWTTLVNKLKLSNRHSLLAAGKSLLPQLVLYYILLSPIVAAPLYNMLLFHPTMTGFYDAHSVVGSRIENVFFSSGNGVKLHGWFLRKAGAQKVVLISHGNGGNLTNRIPLIAMFLEEGLSVFIYDYEGYGRSSGSPSVQKICQNGSAAYDLLLAQMGYKANQIIVFGESLGSGVSCDVASKHEVAAIILQSPFATLRDLAREKILWLRLYPDALFPKEQDLQNAQLLSQPHAPLLIVHGKQDRIISVRNAESIYQLAKPPKTLVELAKLGHNNMYDSTEYAEAVRQFVGSLR